MTTFKKTTLNKISTRMPKLLKSWSKNWNDTDYVVKFANADELWNRYHEDIASDMFYMLGDEMYQYSYFDDAETEGSADYILYEEYKEIVKKLFIEQVGNYLKFTPKEINVSHLQEILAMAKEMSKEEIKKTINELVNLL